MREESLLSAYLDALRRGDSVANAEAKEEFLELFETVYCEENFYSDDGASKSFADVRELAAMEPVVSVELPSIEEMNLRRYQRI